MPRKKRLPTTRPPNQPAINQCFYNMADFCDETIAQHPNLLIRNLAIRFRMQRQYDNPYDVYLGTFGDYCYYRNHDFTEYYAYALMAQGKQAGYVYLDDECFVCGLEVKPNFQFQGIGTQLIRLANITTHEPGQRPRLMVLQDHYTTHAHDERALTEAGYNLIRHCMKIGILQHDQLITSNPISPPNSQSSPY